MDEFDLAADLGMADPVEALETPAPPQEPTKAPTPGHPTPPQEEPKPPEPEHPKSDAIPMAVSLDWRDQMKAEKKRADALEARLRDLEAPAHQGPSVTEDPEGFADKIETKTRLSVSLRFARKEYGDEVEEASKWLGEQANTDPTILTRFRGSDDPYGFAVQEFRNSQLLTRLAGKSFEDAAREWAESQGYAAAPAAPSAVPIPAPPTRQPASPTRSLAAASSAGGPTSVPTHDGAAFEEVFVKG